jgi:hypothetical protein
MTFRGRVQNGVVVPEAGAVLPEGAEVRIDVGTDVDASLLATNPAGDSSEPSPRSMYERYQNIIGVVHDLPADASQRVDDFLYGSASS